MTVDEWVYEDLPQTQRDAIARAWQHRPGLPGEIFASLSAESRYEIYKLTLNGNGSYAQEVERIAVSADEATNGSFDELVGNRPDPLSIEDLAAMLARVDAAPPPRFIVAPFIAACDYGILAGEFKAQKTFTVTDLLVSVASNTRWLGRYEVGVSGPVLLFAGEGGARKITRRIRAICEDRGLDPATLPIRICLRVPHLTSEAVLALVEAEIAATRPVLVVIDPLYLAARGARGSDLYEMGAHLEGIQVICQRHGAALLLVHHWNKTGEGRGAKRMTGVGPEAWGRILISTSVLSRSADNATGGSSVVFELDFQGDEIAETTARFRRRIWTDDPADLTSPMHYEVTALEVGADDVDPDLVGLRPSTRRVMGVLDSDSEWWSVRGIGDRLASDRAPLKARTIQGALAELVDIGMADSVSSAPGLAGQWRSLRTSVEETEAADAL